MTKNATEAKRAILEAQPVNRFKYVSASADIVNTTFAGHMAKHHPDVRMDDHDSFALGEYQARKYEQRHG